MAAKSAKHSQDSIASYWRQALFGERVKPFGDLNVANFAKVRLAESRRQILPGHALVDLPASFDSFAIWQIDFGNKLIKTDFQEFFHIPSV